jgi:acetolactate synthase regulatory subunit
MFVILRDNDGKWEVAAQDVKEGVLERTMRTWRNRGYSVLSVRTS